MNNRRSKRAPAFTAMHFALILLCLVLVSAHATMGLYASYKTECSGTDSARVAKFDVELNYDEDTNTLTITNNSEVTVDCVLSYNNNGVALGDEITITFEQGNALRLQPGQEVSGVLKHEDNSTESHGEIKVDISVDVTQVD